MSRWPLFVFALYMTSMMSHADAFFLRSRFSPAWGPEHPEWTETVLKVVNARLRSFEQARDRNLFCPGYDHKSRLARENCWLMLVSAVSEFESSFRPGDAFREPDGSYSVGLLALSPGECRLASSVRQLEDPEKNLICGTIKMADLIAYAGYIDSPHNEGAASYWSTLRPPYQYGRYKLGKKYQIRTITKHYAEPF